MAHYDSIHTVRDLIRHGADTYADRDFLRYIKDDGIAGVTFRAFQRQTDAIAAWTMAQSEKLGRRVKVAMLSPNNPVYAAVMFGVMSGNGIAVPMDPQITQEALCNCVNRAEVDIIIHHQAIKLDREGVRKACPTVTDILFMDTDCPQILESYRDAEPEPDINPRDCAIIIFTSGATGVEKGVMLSHGNLIDTTFNGPYSANIKVSILPMHHAFSLKVDFLSPLGVGSTTCFHNGMDKLGEALRTFEPTRLTMVPMIANALYTKVYLLSQRTGRSMEECKSLVFGTRIETIITGGAHLPSELVDKYHAIGIFIAQGYGMTECSPSITAPNMDRFEKAYSSGQLVIGCEARIVDGEVQVKSPSVMMGYVNAPELTREAITEDGWLRTGDVGYVDEERYLYITGRIKNLIILSNGENVAPEQLENLLLDHQLVEECLVYGDGNQVVAEIYPNEKYAGLHGITDIPGAVEQVVRDVNSKVTSYQKIMQHIVRKTPFRKTGSNKIARKQRATAEDLYQAEAAEQNGPATELQMKLHDIIAQIMGHGDFGVSTDLFGAGLDSLGCILILRELQEQMDFNVELDELMANATVKKLEELYLKKNAETKVDYTPRPIYPLTKTQMYFVYVMRGNTTSNIPFLYRLDPSIDLHRLKKAVEGLFEVNPILKSVVQMFQNKGFALFRHDDLEVDIPICRVSADEWREIQPNLVKPYLYRPDEPLYHIAIYEVEGDKYLFLDVAHVISDGMTLGLLLRTLNMLYAGQPVARGSYSFYEYLLDDKFREENGLRLGNELYFQKLMDGLKLNRAILNRRNNGDLTTEINGAIHSGFSKISRAQVDAFSQKHGISKNILFLAAFNHCVGLFMDKDDVISTSIHNGRTDSRWGTLAGCLFGTYNFRYRLERGRSVVDLLSVSAKQVMETMCCHVNNLHADEMFIQYQGDLFADVPIAGKPAQSIPLQLDSLPFHLMIHEGKNRYIYELRYWQNRYSREQLEIFMEVYEAVVNGMLAAESADALHDCVPEVYRVKDRRVCMDGAERCVTILDRNGDVQPVGGWGRLIVDGADSGRVARVLTDNTVDYLEDSGRCVMQETVTGRYFVDLYQLETALKAYPGVTDAEAYISYGENNKLILTAEVAADAETDLAGLKEYAAEKFKVSAQPSKLFVNGKEVS